MSVNKELLVLYHADDLPEFILKWRKQNPGRVGAVNTWLFIAHLDGAYDDVELVSK